MASAKLPQSSHIDIYLRVRPGPGLKKFISLDEEEQKAQFIVPRQAASGYRTSPLIVGLPFRSFVSCVRSLPFSLPNPIHPASHSPKGASAVLLSPVWYNWESPWLTGSAANRRYINNQAELYEFRFNGVLQPDVQQETVRGQ